MNPRDYEVDRREEIREKWHVGKEIPISLILTLLLVVGSNIAFKQQVEDFMLHTETRLEEMQRDIRERTADRIHSTTVREMFRTKDAEIKSLGVSVAKIENVVEGNTDLLQQILREMPRVNNANRNQ